MKKLLVIVGPTGTGKTDLGIELAKKFDGEIVSADSRQIYKGMDIGTGKKNLNSKSEIQKFKDHWLVDGIPIYLYDIFDPDKTFSVAQFQQIAYKKIREIQEKKKLPILVGGTGLYVRSVVQGLKIPNIPPDPELRSKLEKKSLESLLNEIEEVDPKAYLKVDKRNKRRVIRALEIFHKTGKTISKLQKFYKPDFESLIIGLTAKREYLYGKVDKRIAEWVKSGFVEEVKSLLKEYSIEDQAMNSLGYRQIASYIYGNLGLEEAIQRIKFDHHGYIRRQLTWFKKEPNIFWFDISSSEFKKEVQKLVDNWF